MGREAGSASLAPHLAQLQRGQLLIYGTIAAPGISWPPETWDLAPHNAHRVKAVTLIHTTLNLIIKWSDLCSRRAWGIGEEHQKIHFGLWDYRTEPVGLRQKEASVSKLSIKHKVDYSHTNAIKSMICINPAELYIKETVLFPGDLVSAFFYWFFCEGAPWDIEVTLKCWGQRRNLGTGQLPRNREYFKTFQQVYPWAGKQ